MASPDSLFVRAVFVDRGSASPEFGRLATGGSRAGNLLIWRKGKSGLLRSFKSASIRTICDPHWCAIVLITTCTQRDRRRVSVGSIAVAQTSYPFAVGCR